MVPLKQTSGETHALLNRKPVEVSVVGFHQSVVEKAKRPVTKSVRGWREGGRGRGRNRYAD